MASSGLYRADLSLVSSDTRRLGFNSTAPASSPTPRLLFNPITRLTAVSLDALYVQDLNVGLLSPGLQFTSPSTASTIFTLSIRRCLITTATTTTTTTTTTPTTSVQLLAMRRVSVLVSSSTFLDVHLHIEVSLTSLVKLDACRFTTSPYLKTLVALSGVESGEISLAAAMSAAASSTSTSPSKSSQVALAGRSSLARRQSLEQSLSLAGSSANFTAQLLGFNYSLELTDDHNSSQSHRSGWSDISGEEDVRKLLSSPESRPLNSPTSSTSSSTLAADVKTGYGGVFIIFPERSGKNVIEVS